MQIEIDPAKSAKNERERGLSFLAAARLFDSPWFEWEDRRKDYGETRSAALGEIEGEVYFAAFTRRGEAVRVISFRRANTKEKRLYREHISGRSARSQD